MTRYEQGFITKCAEYGVDGKWLLKQAKIPIRNSLQFIERTMTGRGNETGARILSSLNMATAAGRPYSKPVKENLMHLDRIFQRIKDLNETGWVGSHHGAKLKNFITALDTPVGDNPQKQALRNLLLEIGYMQRP